LESLRAARAGKSAVARLAITRPSRRSSALRTASHCGEGKWETWEVGWGGGEWGSEERERERDRHRQGGTINFFGKISENFHPHFFLVKGDLIEKGKC
jgi:hypothetical protein